MVIIVTVTVVTVMIMACDSNDSNSDCCHSDSGENSDYCAVMTVVNFGLETICVCHNESLPCDNL